MSFKLHLLPSGDLNLSSYKNSHSQYIHRTNEQPQGLRIVDVRAILSPLGGDPEGTGIGLTSSWRADESRQPVAPHIWR